MHLATGCPSLVNLVSIVQVSIVFCYYSFHYLFQLIQSLSHCELITDEGIRHLAMGLGVHDRLKVLELDNCPLITDAALEYLRECRLLEKIELYDCQLITRSGIRRFKVFGLNEFIIAYTSV